MRRATTIFYIAAVLASVGRAAAQGYDAPLGTWYFNWSNNNNGGYNWDSPFNDPTTTTQGALWIQTGNAAPTYLSQDVNAQLRWRLNDTDPWTTIITLLRGTNDSGPAKLDMMYPGYFWDVEGSTGWGVPDSGSYYEQPAGGHSQYWLPGTAGLTPGSADPLDNYPTGLEGNGFFDMYFWTGDNVNTFADAVAGGQYVAHVTCSAGWGIVASGYINFPTADTLELMPAVTLKTSLPGDANLDGKVDINDLTIVLANYGQTGATWAQGEFTGSGAVDINDLTIVLANYNQSAGASAGGMAAVPEPSTIAIAAAALLGLLACRRRQRR